LQEISKGTLPYETVNSGQDTINLWIRSNAKRFNTVTIDIILTVFRKHRAIFQQKKLLQKISLGELKGIVSPDWKGLQMVSLDRFEV
jgi:hypothetical protein